MLSKTYTPKLPRWAHQNKAMAAMAGHPGFALFMEMRTGKTKVILDEFGQDVAAGDIENLLVIAPAGVYRTWDGDAMKHLSNALSARVRIGCWESGAGKRAQAELKDFMAARGVPRILLVNVEALSTVEAARVLCTLFVTQGPTTVVMDESTTIKNGGAKRTKFCLRLGRLAKKRRILSGLPTPQSPLDIFSQFDFIEPGATGYTNYNRFQERYAIMQPKPYGPGGRLINVVTGYQNLDELQARLAPYSFRVRLAECYDLPEKMYIRRDVEMTEEQRRLYRQMQEYATAQLDALERVTATVVLTQMLRLHQFLAGTTKSDDGKMMDISENKTEELLSILENHAGKAIIWAAYDQDVRKISAKLIAVYGPRAVSRFWGGNLETREHEEKLFKTDPQCRFMVATAAAGGRGRTWDVADVIIYFNNTFSLEHRMQSEERAQMVGKKTSVAYFDLVCRGTVEDKILHALRNKMNLADAVTGDDYRSWIA